MNLKKIKKLTTRIKALTEMVKALKRLIFEVIGLLAVLQILINEVVRG